MQKLQAKSKEKKYVFENITPNTRETNAVSMLPQNTERKSALTTNSPSKTRLLKKEYLHIKPLAWMPTQFVEHKRQKTKKKPLLSLLENFRGPPLAC